MTVTNVEKNKANLTMTITAEFDAPVERVWQLWENPRLLERWWGPPTYPATFTDFNMNPGGNVGYYMTGPEGERHGGWWRFVKISAPHSLEFEDGVSFLEGYRQAVCAAQIQFDVALKKPLLDVIREVMAHKHANDPKLQECFVELTDDGIETVFDTVLNTTVTISASSPSGVPTRSFPVTFRVY